MEPSLRVFTAICDQAVEVRVQVYLLAETSGNKAKRTNWAQACQSGGVFRGLRRAATDCIEAQRSRYYPKISGPLLDHIDIVLALKFREVVSQEAGELKRNWGEGLPSQRARDGKV